MGSHFGWYNIRKCYSYDLHTRVGCGHTSKLIENKRSNIARPTVTNRRCICKADNITIIPISLYL